MKKPTAQMQRLMDDINAVPKSQLSENNTLEEHLFVRDFLPLFLTEDENVDLRPWIKVAGNATKYVDVIKGGQVLFTVPPLLDLTAIEVDTKRGDRATNLLQYAEKRREISPNQAKAIFDQAIQAMPIKRKGFSKTHLGMWNEILKRYGHEPLSKDQVVPTTTDADLDSDEFVDI